MRKYLLCLGMGSCLTLLLLTVETRAADPDVEKEVEKASENAATKSWADVVQNTESLGKYDLQQVMHLMATRNPANNKGGVGIGVKPGGVNPDGIEAKIGHMTKTGIPPDELAGNMADFMKMADRLAVIAAATYNHTPPANRKDPGWVIWKQSSTELFERSQEFTKAVAAKKNNDIKKAAEQLQGTCKKCHAAYS